ncbi:6204_t:CDS:2 [Entrophospora sp. SA101]|nr:6204_t:CDS:2 [Entrophospora sp. SA101]
MEHSPNIKLLIERLNLPKEQKKILENPPEIVKMTIDHLVSFSNKPRKKPPRIQNAWSIFLKNFGEYLRKTFPDETFPIEKISRMAAGIWNNLEDTDLTKIYFRILAKIAEENRKFIFFENNNNNIQTISCEKKWKWKAIVNNENFTTSSSSFPSPESLVQDNTQCSTQEVGPEHFSPEELNQLLQFIENDNINTDEMAAFIPRPYVIGGYNGSTLR